MPYGRPRTLVQVDEDLWIAEQAIIDLRKRVAALEAWRDETNARIAADEAKLAELQAQVVTNTERIDANTKTLSDWIVQLRQGRLKDHFEGLPPLPDGGGV